MMKRPSASEAKETPKRLAPPAVTLPQPKKTIMANTWDELPIEMMGERPDAIYFMKERPNDTASSKADTSAPNTTKPSSN